MQKKNVLIVYQFIADYRTPVFLKLNESESISFTFAADTQSIGNIKLVNEEFYKKVSFIKLKNTWFKSLLLQRNLISTIYTGKYDAVIFLADPNFLTTWLAIIVSKLKSQKIIFWTHGIVRDNSLKSKVKLFFYKFADRIFLYGDKAKNNLLKHDIPEKKLIPIYNSLNYEEHKKQRKLHKDAKNPINFADPNLFQLIFIGRLTLHKKLDQIIKLLLNLKQRNIEINLLFVGDGPAREYLEELAYKDNKLIGYVHFYGRCYSENEIAPLIMTSDLCVSPGEVGLTAMHVMGYGVPVVTHDDEFSQMPEYEAVIKDFTGKLFKKDSIDSLTEAVIDYIQNPILDVNKNCIETIENKYSPEAQSKIIIKSLLEALNEN